MKWLLNETKWFYFLIMSLILVAGYIVWDELGRGVRLIREYWVLIFLPFVPILLVFIFIVEMIIALMGKPLFVEEK